MRVAGFLVALGAVAAASGAWACEGSKVLYEDHFATYDPSWGTHGDELTIENGQMVIRPIANLVYWQTNDLARYGDVDACVDVTMIDSVAPDQVLGGLVFWYVDDDNLYALEVDASGHASIWRRTSGAWRTETEWQDTSLLTKGDGVTNHIRVVTRGDVATAYVNGKSFAAVASTTPRPDGQSIGLIAGSAPMAVSTVAFDELKVTQPD